MMLKALVLLSALAAPPADSVSGTWQIKGDVMGNPLNATCTFKQSGAVLTGSCTAEGGTQTDVTGAVKDANVTFRYGGNYEGEPLTIVYTGTLASAKEIRGTVNVLPFDVGGSFTATPAPARP